jgi:hypothetical protein
MLFAITFSQVEGLYGPATMSIIADIPFILGGVHPKGHGRF